jgi:hypothetical protein
MWQKLAEMWRKLSTGGKALTILVTALVVIILLFCFLPVMKVPYDVEESYLTTETYYQLETYTVEEEYTVLEPYTEIEIQCDLAPCTEYIPIDYVIVGAQGVNYFKFDGTPACLVELTITNTDVISGDFTVEFLLTLNNNAVATTSGTNYVEAGSTKTITAYFDVPLKTLYSFTYSVTAPQKPDPSYHEVEVTKYREVTKFGEVTKEEYVPVELTVLKTQMVTAYKRVSLLSYLLNY